LPDLYTQPYQFDNLPSATCEGRNIDQISVNLFGQRMSLDVGNFKQAGESGACLQLIEATIGCIVLCPLKDQDEYRQ
jgi:hypothetical protein